MSMRSINDGLKKIGSTFSNILETHVGLDILFPLDPKEDDTVTLTVEGEDRVYVYVLGEWRLRDE